MSEAFKDGGPAFPGQWDHGNGQIESWTGMSVRDYAAIKAMEAMCGGTWPDADERREIAKRSWAMAEEMLKTRPA